MLEKESALPSVTAEGQGSKIDSKFKLRPVSSDVKASFEKKSKDQLHQEYLINTFSRFKLLYFAQNKLVERRIISQNSNYSKCHRSTLGGWVSLVRNPETSRAYYNNVVTCGKSMLCPVCSPRIMGKRSAEIKKAVHLWLNEDSKNTCYMMTFTFAHTAEDRLSDLLNSFKNALKKFWESDNVKRQLKASGRVGRISSTEIQCSEKNGWHPHQHVLLFCRATDFRLEDLRRYWLNALNASGLSGLSDIAFDLVEARSAEAYLTKISSEMALGNVKTGRLSGHYSPMELLQEMHSGSDWAASRFCELFEAAKGLHSLFWSRGLKQYFGIFDVSDLEITEGAAQSELKKFLDFVSDGFRLLPNAQKALLRNYAADNDFDRAVSLLSKFNIQYQ